jgi:adenine deaminase
MDAATRQRAMKAALGEAPFDLLLAGGTIIDVVTGELRPADVGIIGPMIASVHPTGTRKDAANIVDVTGQYLSPGFIDTHVHFESSHMLPHHYAAQVVSQGTTTVFYDPHELANVLGLDGVRYAIEASRDLPVRFLCAAPSSVPSAETLEVSGAVFGGAEMTEMLSWPEVAGVAEMMDMRGVLTASPRMMAILEAGLRSGKRIEGHARGLVGPQLQAYLAAGVTSDHEIASGEDVLEKLRSGLAVEIRGSHDHLLPGVVDALRKLPHLSAQVSVCTDDVPPDYLVEKGGICDVIRRLIRYGMKPTDAIRCATLNGAIRLRRDDLGAICAGRMADIVTLRDLEKVKVASVIVSGVLVAQDGRLLRPIEATAGPILPRNTIKLSEISADNFRIPVHSPVTGHAKIRAIRGIRYSQWEEVDVEVRDGAVVVPPGASLNYVQHRHGRHSAPPRCALQFGIGEMRGAIATTYSHDAHNLVVLGRDVHDMALAANAVIRCGGGMAIAKDGNLLTTLELPIAGMLSQAEPEMLAEQFRQLRNAAAEVTEWIPPYWVFKSLEGTSLACNPGPHLTDLGLTDGSTVEIVSTELSPNKLCEV